MFEPTLNDQGQVHDLGEAQQLVGLYFQISRKYRTVARFPEGLSGKQALADARPDRLEWVEGMREYDAGDHYLRVYGTKDEQLVLTQEAFQAYRAAGGDTYQAQILYATPPPNTPVSWRGYLRAIVDAAWQEATESGQVPSTKWADRIIETVPVPQVDKEIPEVIRKVGMALHVVDTVGDALRFYASPETYHAIAFFPDPPCGAFMEDFSDDHGDEFYDRPMPGKAARALLEQLNAWWKKESGDH